MAVTDKVMVNNLCAWPLYFRRANGVGDIRVPANAKSFSMLDIEEVRMQIQLGNKLFIGDDSLQPGDHVRLYIVDDAQRNELFGLTAEESKNTLVLNDESMKELLAISAKKAFNEHLKALVTTDAEKKMVAQLAKDVGGDEILSWKMDAISKIAETAAI